MTDYEFRQLGESEMSRKATEVDTNQAVGGIPSATFKPMQEISMIVQNVTLINGVSAIDVSLDVIIEGIEGEISKIARLEKLQDAAGSKGMEILISKHKETVKQLSEILDSRVK